MQFTLQTTVPDRPAVLDVLQEHLEEVAFLLIQWRKLLFSPDVPLRRLPAHAERIDAHLDALSVGGPASVSLARAMLSSDDPWQVCAAARVWLDLGRSKPGEAHERLGTAPPELRGAWKEALRQLPPSTVQTLLPQKDFEALSPELLEIAADVWGWHGLASPEMLPRLAASPLARVRYGVARHAVQPGIIAPLLEDQVPMVRRAALWSLALQSPDGALERARAMLNTAEPDAFALRVIGLLGDHGDTQRLLPLLNRKPLVPFALLALGDLAYPEVAEVFLQMMEGEDAEAAAAAKEVFESLAGRVPAPDPGQPLPPGVTAARFYWERVRKPADPSRRLLHGQPFPWSGPPSEEPMKCVWRRALLNPTPDLAWLRREVPDGFFSGSTAFEAIPGE